MSIFKKVILDTNRCVMLKPLWKDKDLKKSEIWLIRNFKTVVYSGKEDEDYVATRARIYQGLKSKSSMLLPPDPDSIIDVMKRVHYQVYHWIHCSTPLIKSIPLEKSGWIISIEDTEVNVRPCWFIGSSYHHHWIKEKKKR